MLLGLPGFELLHADSVDAACQLLAEHGAGTRVLAGGTDLFTKMKHRRFVPKRLINIKRIPQLDRIDYDERGGLSIGPLAKIQAIEASSLIALRFPTLSQAARVLGTAQIRNTGTLGGNLANGSPSAEFAPALLTLDATIVCVGSGGIKRSIPFVDFFVAPGRTALRSDELIIEIRIPNPPESTQTIYFKHSLRKMDVAIASAAVLICMDGDVCRDVRIALGAVGPTPFRARHAERALTGRRLGMGSDSSELLDEVASLASDQSVPIDDFRGYAQYRRKLIRMLVGKGLERMIAQARH
jgi:CO/xanthine dehydrogenase FAD-binding subunit